MFKWIVERRYKKEVEQLGKSVVYDVVNCYATLKEINPDTPEKQLRIMVLDKLVSLKQTDEVMNIVNDCAESIQGICYLLAFHRHKILNELMVFRLVGIFVYIDELLKVAGFPPQSRETRNIVCRGLEIPASGVNKVMDHLGLE